jgi:hypothetical protein
VPQAPAEPSSPTTDASIRDPRAPRPRRRRLYGWNGAIALSTAVVVTLALALGIGWIVSRRSQTVTYSVGAPLTKVSLTVSSGDAVIVGSSSSTLQVKRTDDYAFGRSARERRSFTHGVLTIDSGCPKIVLGSCSESYELEVPQSVAVHVKTVDGDVRMTGFSGDTTISTQEGNVDVEAYCGFSLSARSRRGSLHAATACAPQRLDLATGSGDAAALVPPGRYRIGASSGIGREHVAGVVRDERAAFTIDVHSGSGSVEIEGGL